MAILRQQNIRWMMEDLDAIEAAGRSASAGDAMMIRLKVINIRQAITSALAQDGLPIEQPAPMRVSGGAQS